MTLRAEIGVTEPATGSSPAEVYERAFVPAIFARSAGAYELTPVT
ncbi:MAG: hypothetical protein ABIP77_10470 [Candidatus Limnocylindrales bacterium]